jgi:hypothetical protein
VSEPGLQRARVVTFVGKSESAGVAKAWGRTGNGILARSPMRANNPWNDFGVIGPPRSAKKTCDDGPFSRWRRRSALISSPASGGRF